MGWCQARLDRVASDLWNFANAAANRLGGGAPPETPLSVHGAATRVDIVKSTENLLGPVGIVSRRASQPPELAQANLVSLEEAGQLVAISQHGPLRLDAQTVSGLLEERDQSSPLSWFER